MLTDGYLLKRTVCTHGLYTQRVFAAFAALLKNNLSLFSTTSPNFSDILEKRKKLRGLITTQMMYVLTYNCYSEISKL